MSYPNILHVAHHPQTGGGFWDLINRVNARVELSSREANQVVLVDSPGVETEAKIQLDTEIATISFLGPGKFDIENKFSAAYTVPSGVVRLATECIKNEIDVIHSNSFRAAWLSSIVSSILDVPMITHVHHFTYLNHPRICSYIFSQSNYVIHVSKYSRNRYFSNINIKDYSNHKIIRSPVNIEKLINHSSNPDKLKEEYGISDQSVVSLIGRIAKNKGHTEFLRAAKKVSESVDDSIFLIVGEGDTVYKNDLKDLSNKLNLEKNVIFTGYWENITDVYSLTDIIVVPSSNENLPKVIQESFAHKTPVIAKDSGGISELVIDGSTGILIDESDQGTQLAKNITKILSSNAMAKELAENGHEKIIQEYSVEGIRDELEKIYDALVQY